MKTIITSGRQQGKSWQAQHMAAQPIDKDWSNPPHPFHNYYYSEFKPIGRLVGIHAYQVHNKNLTAMGQYAHAVPTLDGKIWFCAIEKAIYAVRPWVAAPKPPMPEGHVILWRRSHKLCDIEQAVAALLMLHERVAIVRSFDAGEKL